MPSRHKTLLSTIGILSFLGFADAAYLTAEHYLTLPLPCSITHGCATVLTSQYATLGPIPVSLLGAFYYITALFLVVYLYTSETPDVRAIRGIFILTGLAAIVSCWFLYLQFFVIHAICMYCFTSDTLSVILFICTSVLYYRDRTR